MVVHGAVLERGRTQMFVENAWEKLLLLKLEGATKLQLVESS